MRLPSVAKLKLGPRPAIGARDQKHVCTLEHIKVFWFFSSEKNRTSFLKKRSKKLL
jgi:hypothetical protein